jgi:hypothetical protein
MHPRTIFFPYRNKPVGYRPPCNDSADAGQLFLFLLMILGFFILRRAAMKACAPRDKRY